MLRVSEKLKFSIKVSLSMALAFLIPFSQGFEQATTAAITIMLIATIGSVNDSLVKGSMRVLGTLIGAIVGMSLIALFPQDRLLYLISLSICVSIALYLVRAYKGDPSIFMLSAMTMLMVFDSGAVDDVFIYGIDKIYMSIFGIVIYTLIGIFIWTSKVQDSTLHNALSLSQTHKELFLLRSKNDAKYAEVLSTLRKQETILEASTLDLSTSSLDAQQWNSILHNYKNINKYLNLEMSHTTKYTHHDKEIALLFESISLSLISEERINIPSKFVSIYDKELLKSLPHLERASLISEIQNIKKLHNQLCILAEKLNALYASTPTFFDIEEIPKQSNFIWGNVEHIKGVAVTFIIFWTSVFIWINFNPPGGFMVVALATGLSVLTTFTPVKPSTLIKVFTISFVFAILMYIFVLPTLHYGWELALFIFLYSFIAFYLLPQKLTIFFLLGMFTLGLSNQMHYNFAIFLSILLMFYIFLILLQIFYYIPFSTKAEDLFLSLKKRFFFYAHILFAHSYKVLIAKDSLFSKITALYAHYNLQSTHKAMQLWASQIDFDYFQTMDKDILNSFIKESEKFAYFSNLLYYQNIKMKHNPLVDDLNKINSKVLHLNTDESTTLQSIENHLDSSLCSIDFTRYEQKDIIDFYENMNLRKSVWFSFFTCKNIINKLDLSALEQSKF